MFSLGPAFLLSWNTRFASGPIRPPVWFSEPTREQFGSNKNSLPSVFNTMRSLMLPVSA